MMLGEPDRVMEKEKFFQYWWKEVQGVVGGYFGGFFGYTYSLHIYFDENNVVKNFEIKRKGFAGMVKTYLPDDFLFELYSGKYAEIGIPGISEIELEKDGKGVWRVLGNETSFKWSIADNEIRLDTKSEIIIVQISDSVLEIPLQAGTGHRQFKKTK